MLIHIIWKCLRPIINALLNIGLVELLFIINYSKFIRSQCTSLISKKMLIMVLLSIKLIVLSYLIHISDLRLKHLISTFTFLLLFLCLALASFVLGHHSSCIVLLLLLECRLLSVYIQNIMIHLNRSINSNYLSLKSNFHYVHINVYSIFDIILIWLVLILLTSIVSNWLYKLLLLLSIHLQLGLISSTSLDQMISCFIHFNVLLSSSTILVWT